MSVSCRSLDQYSKIKNLKYISQVIYFTVTFVKVPDCHNQPFCGCINTDFVSLKKPNIPSMSSPIHKRQTTLSFRRFCPWHRSKAGKGVNYSIHFQTFPAALLAAVSLECLDRSKEQVYHLTFPNDPCPRTLSSSNCAGSAFSHPSFTWWVIGISFTLPSSCDFKVNKTQQWTGLQ